ncbi:DNA/RNA helicase domain-containing protein [Flavobacterium reichenbachii]|uniref:DNA 3'-5' helicase II n=1 Tax=Flavobacterium reichenbachii TaxID=362418 RepID=A0A085ZFQ6_9FLAO|nr:DNA/RNA helicase domain-containing protein [Flavobacterium reichenbachii]KFF03270.1 hypothetical protein IW19_20445 [Flavobacterium reichenbachii]OXB15251.1 hypothetical protein B0A68_11050 [Flavobacterium reichenbachii]
MPDFIFRLPVELQLTDTQRIALDYESSTVVSGGPGSGKTVVTIYKFLSPIKNEENAMLFTYNKTLLASIRGLLRDKADDLFGDLDQDKILEIINNNVASFSKFYGDINYGDADEVALKFSEKVQKQGSKYSEILFDEAQDLTPAVFAHAFSLADKVSCGVDDAQNLQGNFRPDEAVSTILENLRMQNKTELQELDSNFRNTKEIFEFARSFVPEDENVQNIDSSDLDSGELPEIFDSLTDEEQLKRIRLIIENNPASNIGILVNYSNQVDTIKDFLVANGYSCDVDAPDNLSFSYYYHNMNPIDQEVIFERLKTPFILTYDSCKGLEFEIVIMPFFNDCQRALTKGKKVKKRNEFNRLVEARDENNRVIFERNADGTIKMYATPNHYYVGATRARRQLYVLCNRVPDILSFYNK